MNYDRVHIDALGYELAPVVVSSEELEERLAPVYEKLRLPAGQLQALTGIVERRWWDEDYPLSRGAAVAGRKALQTGGVNSADLGVVIYCGVNREAFEPATACHVAAELGVHSGTAVFDLCNACLGVLNGIIDVANRIQLGQIRAGLVVSCETAREINDVMIDRMIERPEMDYFAKSLATLTGGSGAAAVLLTDGSFGGTGHRLMGGVSETAPEFHGLCTWGLEHANGRGSIPYMSTDATSVLKHGVELGARTWQSFLGTMNWQTEQIDRVICHQVGQANRDIILNTIGVPQEKDFSTFEHLGNMGTVSLPLTAALADERGFFQPGDKIAWLGIGSGLNCLMLGLEW